MRCVRHRCLGNDNPRGPHATLSMACSFRKKWVGLLTGGTIYYNTWLTGRAGRGNPHVLICSSRLTAASLTWLRARLSRPVGVEWALQVIVTASLCTLRQLRHAYCAVTSLHFEHSDDEQSPCHALPGETVSEWMIACFTCNAWNALNAALLHGMS